MSYPIVKICGVSDAESVDAALDAGADMIGFVFFERSPRHLAPQRAEALTMRVGLRARRVALTVDADDASLDAIVAAMRPDMLQLHGSETPARVAAVKCRYALPVMRALSIGSAADLACVPAFDAVADMLLFDAPAPAQASRPGGNGAAFDWSLLRDLATRCPWLLAGGLHAGNVADALAATGADGVDVSSGVERSPGLKDPRLITAFVSAARAAIVGHASAPVARRAAASP